MRSLVVIGYDPFRPEFFSFFFKGNCFLSHNSEFISDSSELVSRNS